MNVLLWDQQSPTKSSALMTGPGIAIVKTNKNLTGQSRFTVWEMVKDCEGGEKREKLSETERPYKIRWLSLLCGKSEKLWTTSLCWCLRTCPHKNALSSIVQTSGRVIGRREKVRDCCRGRRSLEFTALMGCKWYHKTDSFYSLYHCPHLFSIISDCTDVYKLQM